MDARTAIDLTLGIKEAMDLFGQFAIFSLMGTGLSLVPVVIATD
jgi:hypothetical protein